MEENKRLWGLVRRRQCLIPTWRGWLALLLILLGAGMLLARATHPFLALNAPIPGGILVVEGWAPDYVLGEAVAEFRRNHYEHLFTTGIPIEHGGPLSEYKTYAELGAAVLLKLGLSTNLVQAVPTPDVRQDRTYTSAVALRAWLKEHGQAPASLTVFTAGPHARRSRLLYEKAFGKGVTIGVIAIPVREYDAAHWWRSSPGVRTVLGEAIAYAYVRIFFHPAKPAL
jgi:uncharacterized SAM-binding protein YcdF (DUF218 family)